MKQFSFKRGLLLLLLFAIAHSSRAATSQNYDFKAGGIYYHITSTDESAPTVEVTYLYKNNSSNSDAYSGTISIPETVTDDADAEQSDGAATNTTYSVTAIGEYAFYECADLTSVVIPSSVTSIGTYAFYTCAGLTSIEIPSSVTSIGTYAFKDCESLATLTFAENSQLTSIGNYAFDGIAITSLVIPKSVTSLGNYAFAACSSLTTVTFEEGTQIASFGNYAFANTAITSIEIPNSVTSIGGTGAFNNCKSLASVTFEEVSQVTSIGTSAFYGCSALTDITLPNSVTTIGMGAFFGCTDLTSVTLGESVGTITYEAFADCTSLEEIIVLNTNPPTCTKAGTNIAFNQDDMSTIWLVVPEDYAAVYAAADTWSDFEHLREYTVTTKITTTCDEGSYATRYSPYSYTLEEGLTAYFINGVSEDNALELTNKIEAGGEVPGDCGVLLTGTYNEEYVNYTTKTATYTDKNFDNDSNWLYGTIDSDVNTFVPDYENGGTKDSSDYTFFKLTYGNDDTPNAEVLGFYWGAEEGAPFESTPKKAWLAIPNSEMPASGKLTGFTFKSGDEETTGITAVATESVAKDNVIYNLQGIRVSDMSRPGIYIVNGKKIIKK